MLHFKQSLNQLELEVGANMQNPSPKNSPLNAFPPIILILPDFLALCHVLELVCYKELRESIYLAQSSQAQSSIRPEGPVLFPGMVQKCHSCLQWPSQKRGTRPKRLVQSLCWSCHSSISCVCTLCGQALAASFQSVLDLWCTGWEWVTCNYPISRRSWGQSKPVAGTRCCKSWWRFLQTVGDLGKWAVDVAVCSLLICGGQKKGAWA